MYTEEDPSYDEFQIASGYSTDDPPFVKSLQNLKAGRYLKDPKRSATDQASNAIPSSSKQTVPAYRSDSRKPFFTDSGAQYRSIDGKIDITELPGQGPHRNALRTLANLKSVLAQQGLRATDVTEMQADQTCIGPASRCESCRVTLQRCVLAGLDTKQSLSSWQIENNRPTSCRWCSSNTKDCVFNLVRATDPSAPGVVKIVKLPPVGTGDSAPPTRSADVSTSSLRGTAVSQP